jgi:transcriptional regulator with XRE-family HTH domain
MKKIKVNNLDIGHFIKEKRIRAGISQMKLAEKIGVSYQQFQKYENGKCRISIERLGSIADALKISICSFFRDNSSKAATLKAKKLDSKEMELIMIYRRIRKKQLKRCLIQILKVMVE